MPSMLTTVLSSPHVESLKAHGTLLKLVALVPLLVLARLYYRHRRVQRKIRHIPGPEATSLLGNFGLLHDADKGWDFYEHIQNNFGSVCRITTPIGCNDMLYVADPQALLHITRRDEHLFDDPHEIHIMLQMVLGNKGLGATHGAEHQRQRKILNPIFGQANLKNMPPIFRDVSRKFIDSLLILCADGSAEIDMNHWGTRVSLELVGQGAIGHSFDTLEVDAKPNLYGEEMKQGFVALSTPETRLGIKYILPLIASIHTPAFNRSLLSLVPSSIVGVIRNFIWDLEKTSKELFAQKMRALHQGEDSAFADHVAKGKDLMTGLLRDHVLNDSGKERIEEAEAASHFRTLLFAATDTSSSSILRALLLLAEHQDIQEQVRQEFLDAKSEADGDLPYEKLAALPMLDAVYRETLRLYPPASYVDRVALDDTVLPLAFPVTAENGEKLNEIFVPKGTSLTVSIVGVNRSKGVWGPDASEWRPRRWLEELPLSVRDTKMPGIYSHIMTFLDGKKHCLGYRYIQVEWKVVISEMLCQLKLSPSSKHDRITWPMGLTHSPFVDGKMSMPLVISRV